jgi:long-chain acyl-CoA synthetase
VHGDDIVWGTAVFPGHYAGHAGLLYRPHPRTFSELLAGTERWRDRTFLVQGDRRVTFAGFDSAVDRGRGFLHQLGIRRGERVMLLAYNSPEWALALWSLWAIGAIPILGNRWWSPAEIEHAVGVLDPGHFLTDATPPAAVSVPVTDLADMKPLFAASPSDAPPPVPPDDDEDATCVILFTSGTSGMPKAVELSRRSVICNQHNVLQHTARLPHLLDADAPQTVNLASTPMFHVGGLSNLITHQLTGGKIVFTEGKFDARQILELIQAEKVQSWGAVPTMATRVLEHPDFDSYDLSSLRSWPLGGAPVTTALLQRMRAKVPQMRQRGLGATWGMTEAGGFLTVANGAELQRYPGTVGRPYPVVELKIAGPGPDGIGEILARAPTVMLGYVGIDDDTVDSGGWLHTGDLGHFNDDGYLFIDGRSKDVVIRGGENIACPHVEAALATHPAVVEAAAIGLPHPDLGEELAAVIVYRPDGPAPTEDELRKHLDGVLSYFAIPTRWEIRTAALPTLAGEKIDKKTLASQFAREKR